MVDVTWQEAGVGVQDVAERAKVLNRLRIGDIVFHRITKTAAVFVLVVLGGVIVSLFLGALPALQEFGFGFLTAQSWNPVTEKFGALAPIYGTVVTSLIAMLIAVPFGLMIAMFLTELCPMWLRRPIGIAIELLAGIPSIIYGIWGLFVFAPIHPAIRAAAGDSGLRECARAFNFIRRAALRHRNSNGEPDPGDHGVALCHVDFA